MSKVDDGGPAFPYGDSECGEAGMSLRDYFAAKALQGLLANPTMNPEGSFKSDAELSYSWADAMLAARKAPQ